MHTLSKLIFLASLLFISTDSFSQTTSRIDSLMSRASDLRTMSMHAEAIAIYNQLTIPTARVEKAFTLIEMGQVAYALSEAKQMLAQDDFPLHDDALLVLARCREIQGHTSAARRAYRRLATHEHAEGLYYYAVYKYKRHKYADAEKLLIRSISSDKTLPASHRLLSAVEVELGHRYRAILPLYYYLLIASDSDREKNIMQLRTLWRKQIQYIDLFQKPNQDSDSPYNVAMDKYIASISSDSIAHLERVNLIRSITSLTEKLFAEILVSSADNLDFWQVAYADIFVDIHSRGYTSSLINFYFAPTYNADVLLFLADNGLVFNDFRLWIESRLQH